MDKSSIIEKYLNLIGNACRIEDGGGASLEAKCVMLKLWKNTRTRFEGTPTKVGISSDDYYRVLLAAGIDAGALDEDVIITVNGVRYAVIRLEPYCVGDAVQYNTGIAKRIYEEDENVFN